MKDNQKKKMTVEEAGSKGKAMLDLVAELYTLIDWEEGEELGDPWVKVAFYKSGKFTLENYKDTDITEFNIDGVVETKQNGL
jgi:hypothetical protein